MADAYRVDAMFAFAKSAARFLLPAPLLGHLRAWNVRRMVARFDPRTVHHTYGAHDLRLRLTDPLAVGWYDHDWPEPAEIRFLREHKLRSGATVFDIGAHQGLVALLLAREVTASGMVVAVEANPHNAAAAVANARLNDAQNVVVRCAAVADFLGTLNFNLGLNGQVDDRTGAGGRVSVPAVTIDQLAAECGAPDVLYIDVEGYECQALRGAACTLAKHRPDCFVEVHLGAGLEKFGSMDDLLSHFPTEIYELHYLAADEGAAPTPSSVEELRHLDARFFLLAVARES